MPLIIPKTSISFSDDGKSVEIIVDGVSRGAFPKNKFSVIPAESAGNPDIDLVWYDNEKSEESFFRFNYTLISPSLVSRAAAVTYLRGLFFFRSSYYWWLSYIYKFNSKWIKHITKFNSNRSYYTC